MTEEKQYALEELKEELNEKQKKFCHNYIIDWNTTRSYKKAYGIEDDNSAAAAGCNLLRNVKVKQYINFIKNNLEEESGISKLRNLKELAKIAYSSIAHLHETWIELTNWELIKEDNPDALSAIESIDTKIEKRTYKTDGDNESEIEVKYVKIKLYSKSDAIKTINEMLGYKTAEKTDITSGGEKLQQPIIIDWSGEMIKRVVNSKE